MPTDNNGLERFNKDIKDYGTMRERCQVMPFLQRMKSYLENRSLNDPEFSVVPFIPNEHWRQAQLILNSSSQFQLMVDIQDDDATCIPSAVTVAGLQGTIAEKRRSITEMSDRFLSLVDTGRAPARMGFNAYMLIAKSFYIIRQIPDDCVVHDHLLYSCTCPVYAHRACCKHVIAFGLKNGDFSVPSTKSTQVIGSKAKRGRPRKATSAWNRD